MTSSDKGEIVCHLRVAESLFSVFIGWPLAVTEFSTSP